MAVSDRHDRGRGTTRNLRASFRESGAPRIPLADAAKVHRAADLTRARAERHYETHRETSIARAYTKLLLKTGPTLTLSPPGVTIDPKTAMLARARRDVAHQQAKRLARIDQARKHLLVSGALRKTRDLKWGGEMRSMSAPAADPRRDPLAARGATREQRTVGAKIATAQDRARRRAEAHLVKHQDRWTGTRFTELTARFGLDAGKAPKWSVQQIGDVAMEVANRDVKAKHKARLQRIDQACDHMRATGQVRESRPAGRNVALER